MYKDGIYWDCKHLDVWTEYGERMKDCGLGLQDENEQTCPCLCQKREIDPVNGDGPVIAEGTCLEFNRSIAGDR